MGTKVRRLPLGMDITLGMGIAWNEYNCFRNGHYVTSYIAAAPPIASPPIQSNLAGKWWSKEIVDKINLFKASNGEEIHGYLWQVMMVCVMMV